MNDPRDDKELDQYLDGGSSESRAYAELGDETPPPELDARILAEAERAVKVTPIDSRRAPPFKAFAWAAIVVLSFSLVLNIVFEQAAQDPLAELEAKGKRSAAPQESLDSLTVRSRADQAQAGPGSAEEVVVSARKMEPTPPESAMVARDQPVESVNREADMQEELQAFQQLTQSTGRSEDEAALLFEVRENAATAGLLAEAEKDASLAPNLPGSSKVDGDAQDITALSMEIVADYLAEAEGRSDAVASLATDGEEPRAELTRILDSYNEGDREAAAAALAEFRAGHPEHPVSMALEERGF